MAVSRERGVAVSRERGVAVSRDRLLNGVWHSVLVRRNGRRLYVRLDAREVFTAVVGNRTAATAAVANKTGEEGQQDILETDGQLWIGKMAREKDVKNRCAVFFNDSFLS